jgi:dipeptidyl aminopeptidase/acylaminoacyl peptidase
MPRFIPAILILIGIFIALLLFSKYGPTGNNTDNADNLNGSKVLGYPDLSIDELKKGNYHGSNLKIEQALDNGTNYKRYIASYKSEGLKIYGLLTVPNETPPKSGFPAIIFNHGFIPPAQYRTTERYVAYQDGFARNGYVTFKSDYRGHGSSEGEAVGAYGSNKYTIDVLNAEASVKKLPYVNKDKIGMWGHSLGGFLTLRALVVDPSIKVSVIWGGVVVSYPDLLTKWRRPIPTNVPTSQRGWRNVLVKMFGTPEENPAFWNSISANSYLKNIAGPIQLDYGGADETVPPEFSKILYQELKNAGKTVEIYEYPGDDHNISQNFNLAMERSIKFFDAYLK